jgi:hypothetical protein
MKAALAAQFAARLVDKRYRCLVHGVAPARSVASLTARCLFTGATDCSVRVHLRH